MIPLNFTPAAINMLILVKLAYCLTSLNNQHKKISVVDTDPDHFGKLNPDPHQSGKLVPDPHQSETQDPDPDPHQSEKVILDHWRVQIWGKVSGRIRIRIRIKLKEDPHQSDR
jgi:hypothetical protein